MKQNDAMYYQANKKKLIKRYVRQQKSRAQKFYNLFKQYAYCTVCQEQDVCCLDLHHIDPKQKDFTISSVLRTYTWERIVDEMEKCTVLCRNCHSKVHKYGEAFVAQKTLNQNLATKFLKLV
jgi:5-methylcytosine-specific restriction endonuclease McrA